MVPASLCSWILFGGALSSAQGMFFSFSVPSRSKVSFHLFFLSKVERLMLSQRTILSRATCPSKWNPCLSSVSSHSGFPSGVPLAEPKLPVCTLKARETGKGNFFLFYLSMKGLKRFRAAINDKCPHTYNNHNAPSTISVESFSLHLLYLVNVDDLISVLS